MLKTIIKSWVIPLVGSVGFFLLFSPTLAQFVPSEEVTLSDYLKENNVGVGSESVDGYSKVFYVYENKKNFITEGGGKFYTSPREWKLYCI